MAYQQTDRSELYEGVNGRLSLIMTSYIPNVVCYDPPRPIPRDSCRPILDDMDVSISPRSFGYRNRAEVKLPYTLRDGE